MCTYICIYTDIDDRHRDIDVYTCIYISITFVTISTYMCTLKWLIIECDICRISSWLTYFPIKSNTKNPI